LIEEKLSFLSSRLSKLDQLDEVMLRLDNIVANGGGGGGGQGHTRNNGGDVQNAKRTAADIKADMEMLQKVIFDDKAKVKDREAANLKIDRLFAELVGTDEYKVEVKRAQEEKIRINEPLNKEALKVMLHKFSNIATDDALLARKRQFPALSLITMDHHQIIGKHQNDFNQYLLGDLTLEEVRAIRAAMPIFRRDQKKQHEFVESLDNKIEQLVKLPVASPKPTRVFASPVTKTRPHGIGGRSCSGSGFGGGLAGLAEQLSKRRTAAES